MSRAVRRRIAAAVAVTAVTAVAALATAVEAAAETAEPAAAVSLGDSYISGEAGRRRGNALENSGDKWGTDLATACDANGCATDPRKVYGDTHTTTNTCHRSTSAEIVSAAVPDVTAVDLACSGATTSDVRAGDAARNQPNQVELLRAVVRDYRVDLVVLSVGGNDLGFGAIIADYPSPMPAAGRFRIPESGSRWAVGGCPVWDSDADWAREHLVPTIAETLKRVAANRGARFLDLRDSFDGREVCATDSRQATGADSAANPLPGPAAEWVRWAVTGYTSQGDRQESMHPNHYGQRALGTCLRLMHQKATGDFACRNTPGAGPARMTLTALTT